MKVRVLKNDWYPGYFVVGNTYEARPAEYGKNYMVYSTHFSVWICMFPNELRFICPGVAVPNQE